MTPKELVLGGGAPEYDMPVKEPEYFSKMNNFSIISYIIFFYMIIPVSTRI